MGRRAITGADDLRSEGLMVCTVPSPRSRPLPANTELCSVRWREPRGTLIPLPSLGGGRVRLIFRGKKPDSRAACR